MEYVETSVAVIKRYLVDAVPVLMLIPGKINRRALEDIRDDTGNDSECDKCHDAENSISVGFVVMRDDPEVEEENRNLGRPYGDVVYHLAEVKELMSSQS